MKVNFKNQSVSNLAKLLSFSLIGLFSIFISLNASAATGLVTNFSGSDGSLDGVVNLTWNKPATACPSTYGCGLEILRDGAHLYWTDDSLISGSNSWTNETSFTDRTANTTNVYTYTIKPYTIVQGNVGLEFGSYYGAESTDIGYAGLTISGLKATDGTKSSQVELTWNSPLVTCPSTYGCGVEIWRDGALIFTQPTINGAGSPTWNSATSYTDYPPDSSIHTYAVKPFFDTVGGNGQSVNYFGVASEDRGFSGITFASFKATDGSKLGQVGLNWDTPAVVCPSTYGCGVQVWRDGTLIYTQATTLSAGNATWGIINSYNDLVADSSSHDYKIRAFYDTVDGAGQSINYLGVESSDSGYAAINYVINSFTATDGTKGDQIVLQWSVPQISCPSPYGCGIEVKKDGAVYTIQGSNTDGYAWVFGNVVQNYLSDKSVHRYSVRPFWDAKSGNGTVVGGYLGPEVFDDGYAGMTIQGFSASDGTKVGQVDLTWSSPTSSCQSTYGCGVEVFRDGTLIWVQPVTFSAGNSIWATPNSYTDSVSDNLVHQYSIKTFSDGAAGATTKVASVLAGETFDSGYASGGVGPQPSAIVATKGTVPAAVNISWAAVTNAASYKVYKNGALIKTTPSLSYSDYPLSDKTISTYSVSAFNSSDSIIGGSVAAQDRGWAGNTITGITATKGTVVGSININWVSTAPSVSYYKVFKSVSGVGTELKKVTTNSYNFPVNDTQTYTFYIIAYDSSDAQIGLQSSNFIGYASSPVIDFSATDGTLAGNIKFTWTSVSGADGYKVYEQTVENGDVLIGSPTSNTFTFGVANTELRKFYVKAFTAGTQIGNNSNIDVGFGGIALNDISASDNVFPGKIFVSWNAVSGAAYYSVIKDGVAIGSPTTTSFSNSPVTDTDSHSFLVKAFRSDNSQIGQDSNQDNGSAATLFSYITATKGTLINAIKIDWPVISGASTFKLYKDGNMASPIATLSGNTYTDSSVSSSSTHKYLVSAFDLSNIKIGPDSSWAVGFSANVDNIPRNVKASDGVSATIVTVSWNPVVFCIANEACDPYTAVDNPSNAVLGSYNIYRDNVLIGSVSSSTSTFNDTSAVRGVTYQYSVSAQDTNNAIIKLKSGSDDGSLSPPLPAPTGIVASDGLFENQTQVSWEFVRDATGYEIYRDGVKIGTSDQYTSDYFDATGVLGKVYNYQVAATDKFGTYGKSLIDTGFSQVAQITGVTATDGTITNAVKISWKADALADQYIVLKNKGEIGRTTLTTFTDNNVVGASSYTYSIIAMKGESRNKESAGDVGYQNLAPSGTSSTESGVSGDEIILNPRNFDPNPIEKFSYEILTQPANGTASYVGGKFSFTGNLVYSGPDSFTYKLIDKGGASITGVASLTTRCPDPTVTAANLKPNKPLSMAEVTFNLNIDALGCNTTYDGKMEVIDTVKNTSVFTKVLTGVASGSALPTSFSGVGAGSYIIRTSLTDKISTLSTVSESPVTINNYSLPKLSNSNPNPLEGVDLSTISMALPGVLDCRLTSSASVAQGDHSFCLYEWDSVPSGLSPNAKPIQELTGYFDNSGKNTASINFSIFATAASTKYTVGAASVDINVQPLSSVKYTAPKTLSATQYITPIHFDVTKEGGRDCILTRSVDEAMAAFSKGSFTCLVEISGMVGSIKDTPSGFNGYATIAGESTLNWSVSYFKKGVTKTLISSGTTALSIKAADIRYELEGIAPAGTQLYTKVLAGFTKRGIDTCELTVVPEGAAGKCVIAWDVLPEGINQDTTTTIPKLKGTYKNSGEQTISYKLSYVDLFNNFHLMDTKSINIAVEPTPPPQVIFVGGTILGPDMFGVPADGGVATNLLLDGTKTAVIGLIDFTDGITSSLTYNVFGSLRSRYIATRSNPLWSEQNVTVKVEMKDNTSVSTTKVIKVVSMPNTNVNPQFVFDKNTYGDDKPVEVKVKIGAYMKGGFQYLPESMGTWKIRVLQKVGADLKPISEFTDVDKITGEVSMPIDVSGQSSMKLFAEAQAVSPKNASVIVSRFSRSRDITIVKNKAIDGLIKISKDKPSAGVAPFIVQFDTKLAGLADIRAVGVIKYESKKVGESTWVENTSKFCSGTCVMNFPVGEYDIRARFTNKNSGLVSYSETLNIYAYDGIKINVDGSNVLYPREALGLDIVTKNSNGEVVSSDIEWKIELSGSAGKGKEPLLQGKGNRIDFTYANSGLLSLTIKAVRSDITNPQLKDYVMKLESIQYLAIKKPSVGIVGPAKAETGKISSFTTQIKSNFYNTNTDLKVVGEWILPDGRKVVGDILNWVPTAKDESGEVSGRVKLQYTAWIDGYKDTTSITATKLIDLWTYKWPDFTLSTQILKNVAPTTATLIVSPDDLESFRLIDPKEMTYTWNIDPDITIVKVEGATAKLAIAKAGTYKCSVTISDQRGNSTTLSVPLTSISVNDIVLNMSVKNGSSFTHAPLDLSIYTQASGGYAGDFVKTWDYKLDGAAIDFGGRNYGSIREVGAGKHKITLDITTSLGLSASTSAELELLPNVPPTCTLNLTKVNDTDTYMEVKCNDPDGHIKLYDWYINKTRMTGKGYRWTYKKPLSASDLAVYVKVIDDGDAFVELNDVIP